MPAMWRAVARLSCLAAVFVCAGLAPSAWGGSYTYSYIDLGASPIMNVSALNSSGEATGYYTVGGVGASFVRDTAGNVTSFKVTGATGVRGTVATSINASGAIAGTGNTGGYDEGFIRAADGTITTFTAGNGTLGTQVSTIDNSGDTYGRYSDASGQIHGFIRDAAGNITTVDPTKSISTSITDANNNGVSTGTYDDGYGVKGFIRAADGTITTFGATAHGGANPSAINGSGVVAGTYFVPTDNFSHGFIRAADGTITTFDDPSATQGTHVSEINNDGTVVGYYQTDNGFFGYVRDAAGNFTTVLPPPMTSSDVSVASMVSGINDAGQISGFLVEGDPTTKQAYYIGFIATPTAAVPEPSSMVMLALGACGVAALTRSRFARVS